MKCSTCNAELDSQTTVCPGCGTPVRQVSPETQPQTPPQPETVPPQEGAPQSGAVPPQGYAQSPYGMPPQQPGYGAPLQEGAPQSGAVPPQGYAPQPPYGMPPQQPGYGAPPQVYVQQFGYGMPPQQPGIVPPQGNAQVLYDQKSRTTYQVLSFFLGWLGVADFYAGRIPSALSHLAWMIIGFIVLCCAESDGVVAVGFLIGFANGVWGGVEGLLVKEDGKGVPMK